MYAEFFEQGDLEKDIIGKPTMDMHNRAQASRLPKMQVGIGCVVGVLMLS